MYAIINYKAAAAPLQTRLMPRHQGPFGRFCKIRIRVIRPCPRTCAIEVFIMKGLFDRLFSGGFSGGYFLAPLQNFTWRDVLDGCTGLLNDLM